MKPRLRKARLHKAASMRLPHLDDHGRAHMVDVGEKPATRRVAVAEGRVRTKPETLKLIRDGNLKKGDALAVARIAGISATKRTADLVPLAHPIAITHVAVDVELNAEQSCVDVRCRVETVGPTGVEMEALCGVAGAALAIYDMAKATDRAMTIDNVRVVMKTGGRSGTFRQE